MQIKLILTILGLLIIKASTANQIFVSPNGSDKNLGTLIAPYETVQKAHDVVSEGDTIFIRGGVYYPKATTIFSKRSSGRFFKVLAYPLDAQKPIFDAKDTPENSNTWEFASSSQFWFIKGIEIKGGKDNCIKVSGKNIMLEQGETSYCGASSGTYTNQSGRGVLGFQCSNLTVLNWDSHHNADKGTDNSPKYDDADGFAILAAGPACMLQGCRSWNNSDDGFDFYYGIGNAVTLINCSAWNNGYDDDMGSISGQPNAKLADGNGFKLGGGEEKATGSPHVVMNCYAWENKQRGFDHNGNPASIKILNCTSWNNPLYNYYFLQLGFIRNSISYGAGKNQFGASVDSKFNSWNLEAKLVDDNDFISLDDSQADAKRISDGSLPHHDFLRLANGSNLIDAGIDVGLPFIGNAPDLGSFESDFVVTSSKMSIDGGSLIFPNPAGVNLNFSSEVIIGASYKIITVDGQLLQMGYILDGIIPIENLKPGVYLIATKSGVEERVQRFVKE